MSALNITETHFKIRQTDWAVISVGELITKRYSSCGSLLGFPLLLFLPFLSQQNESVHKVPAISQHHLSSEYSSPFPVLPTLISFSHTQTAHASFGTERWRRSSAGFHFSTARSGFNSLTVYHTHIRAWYLSAVPLELHHTALSMLTYPHMSTAPWEKKCEDHEPNTLCSRSSSWGSGRRIWMHSCPN